MSLQEAIARRARLMNPPNAVLEPKPQAALPAQAEKAPSILQPHETLARLIAEQSGISVAALLTEVNSAVARNGRGIYAGLLQLVLQMSPGDVVQLTGLTSNAVTAARRSVEEVLTEQVTPLNVPLSAIVSSVVGNIGPQYSIFEIKAGIASVSGVSVKEIEGPYRHRDMVDARHLAMALCRHLTNKSLPEIGRRFDRDHTTVSHGIARVQRIIDAAAEVVPKGSTVQVWAIAVWKLREGARQCSPTK